MPDLELPILLPPPPSAEMTGVCHQGLLDRGWRFAGYVLLARTNILPAELLVGTDGLAMYVDLVGLATVLSGAFVDSHSVLSTSLQFSASYWRN